MMTRYLALAIASASLVPSVATAQGASGGAAVDTTVVATRPPKVPLPSEAATAGVTKFSFIMYGDTRGRHDGEVLQPEHRMVVESMLATIKAAATADPIRFVVQSGDAVQNGAFAKQWSVSYLPLIDRLTQEGT